MRRFSRSLTNTRRVSTSTATPCTLFIYPGRVSFPRFASHAKIQHELAIRVELRDARAVISVGHVEGAVGHPGNERWPVEVCRIGARNVGRAERLHQLLAVVGKLVDRMRVVVYH